MPLSRRTTGTNHSLKRLSRLVSTPKVRSRRPKVTSHKQLTLTDQLPQLDCFLSLLSFREAESPNRTQCPSDQATTLGERSSVRTS